MKIFKYPLRIDAQQELDLPVGARVLTVQLQDGKPCLWALVDEDAEVETITIEMIGTGHPVYDPGKYLGTVQMEQGKLVLHVFAALGEIVQTELDMGTTVGGRDE